jgi:hypothetical protein
MLSGTEEGRSERRQRIYPHRSVRTLPLTKGRIYAGLALAVLLTTLIAIFASPIMEAHNRLAAILMQAASLPVIRWEPVDVFPPLQPALAPVLSIPAFADVSDSARLALILSIVVLLIASRRFSLFRNLANFLIVLLFASAVANAVFDTVRLESTTIAQIWVRQQILVWLLMPWVLLLLFVFPQPKLWQGMAWVVLVLLYGFIFSALRMVFILGLLHYTGLIFMPVLWFAFGALSDLLAVLFFYSISVHRASVALWGGRTVWQSQ